MSEYRTILERARAQFPAPDLPLDDVLRRRDRKERNRRIGTAVLALILAAAAMGGLVRAFYPPQTPQPAELPNKPESWTRVQFSRIEAPGTTGSRDSEGTQIWSITAGGPGLVAVGTEDWGPAIWTSADGLTWNTVEQRLGSGWVADVTSGGPGLVAVRLANTWPPVPGDDAPVWTSADGVTWSRTRPHPVFRGARVRAVTAGGPGLVAVGDLDGPRAWFSSDGVTWELASVPPPPPNVAYDDVAPDVELVEAWMQDVVVSGDRLIAVGTIGLKAGPNGIRYHPTIWTSTNGMTWTEVPLGADVFPVASEILSLAAGRGGFVAVGRPYPDTGPAVWTSPDGLRWRRAPSDQDAFVSRAPKAQDPNDYLEFDLQSVAAGPGGYVAVGGDARCIYNVWVCMPAQAAVWTSEDGKVWKRVSSGPVFRLAETGRVVSSAVAAWGDRFVAAGNYGEGTVIWISEPSGG